jgi:6-pyruvoyltetrahydropterin/6-carboxytetrahydropterin synthase
VPALPRFDSGDPPLGGACEMVALTRIYHFSAAHRLESPQLSADDNAALYGRCHEPHGHNYYVEVTVTGRPDPVTGMAVDLGAIDEVVGRVLLDRVDHRDLDRAVPELAGVISTGENLARAFWVLLARHLPSLARVTVVETAKNRFEFAGAGDAGR